MENLGTYFLIALAIGWIIYYSNKKKSSTPQAKAPAKPRAAAAKPNTKKPAPKKNQKAPEKGGRKAAPTGLISQGFPTPKIESEHELLKTTQEIIQKDGKLMAVKFVKDQTGWGLKKAKDYCDRAEEQSKSSPMSLLDLKNGGLGSTPKGQKKGAKPGANLDLLAELTIESIGNEPPKKKEPSKSPKASPAASPQFDLEKEIEQLQARTGWDYAKAKAYCEQALQYQSKIGKPTRLKNS